MHLALWIVQWLVAAVIGLTAVVKLVLPKASIEARQPWARHASAEQIKLIGLVELTGVLGLILPSLLRIAPVLTPLAAAGLVMVMIGAVVVHVRLDEGIGKSVPAIVLALLAAFVAVGRFALAPIV